jgi:hypothetical protein
MPFPSARPNNVIESLAAAFKGREVWPKATTYPEAHYQQLAVMYHYAYETEKGFHLTELGQREALQNSAA